MKTIDFLPQKYRDKSARQRAGVWRLLVVALLGGAVAMASIAQLMHRRSIRAQLDELQPAYADAQAKTAVLARMQTELTQETAAATLYAYLQTPWPRTQLVSAMALPVGKAVRIEQMHLTETAPAVAARLKCVEDAGLNPIAVDIESNALIRAYSRQFRRDEDRQQRAMLVHVGHASTAVVIAQGDETLLMKYLPLGGGDFDTAVAAHLQMEPHEAAALRRHNGDRRADQQDPEVAQSVAAGTRSVLEKLVSELSLCIRYHSVTFRGQPLARLVLGGGEASEALRETLAARLDLKCELFDPLRHVANPARALRQAQWDVAAGLAFAPAGGNR